MKRLRLSFLGLFMSAVAVQGQVVFSEDEKNYVASYASSTSMETTATTPGSQDIPENGFHPSGILSNWYVSGKVAATAFAGTPQGCSDLFDRTTPSLQVTLGKWHTPYFGTRLSFEGLKFKTAHLEKHDFRNYHLDLMLNVSAFHQEKNENMSKWKFVTFIGAGTIHNSTLHKSLFAINYGLLCSYRVAGRLSVSAELGGTTTRESFDGMGNGNRFKDNLIGAKMGLTLDIGKQGWNHKQNPGFIYRAPVAETAPMSFPKNNYRGLKQLTERVKAKEEMEKSNLRNHFDAPILFFFKINTTDLIDAQQKVEIAEIAAAMKEYNLKAKIIGAADSQTGSKQHNRKLSIKRAKYIAKLLIDAGVEKERLRGISQGGINIYKPYTANRHTCVILSKYQAPDDKQ